MSQPAQKQDPPGTEQQMHPAPDHGETSYRGSGRLTGKATVVTGADSGIGKAVAIAFAREGADVVISYLKEHEDAEDTRKWIQDAGRKAVLVPDDLTDPAHCRRVIDRAVDELGRVDVLVSNAAFQMTHQSLEEISDEEWDHTLAVNLSAMFRLCKAALPHMPAGGPIIGTTSVNSDIPPPQLLAYDVTKTGVANFMAGLAQMLADQGIRANSVAPWPHLDSADPSHHARRAGRQLRPAGTSRPARPARRGRPGLRLPGVRRGQLRLRRPDRCHRRKAHPVTPPPDQRPAGSPRYPGRGQDHRPYPVGRAGERRGPAGPVTAGR